jgi:beta-lactam-binding protein with PASTA domain
VRALALALAIAALCGCGSGRSYVNLPSNHGRQLSEALRRLHAVGLRGSFHAAWTPCGEGLPWVSTQSPRAPARVRRGSVVALKFGYSPIPSPGVPLHHARFTKVPKLVGREFSDALRRLTAIWPCVRVRAASATSSSRVVVITQKPGPGTQVPAFGVVVGHSFRPTTVELTVGVA